MERTWKALLPWATRSGVYRECRQCGSSVDGGTDECPECDGTDIAEYEIP
jgi:rubrerythrin